MVISIEIVMITPPTKAEYALKALFELASRPPGEPVKIGEISGRWKIPQKFLETVLAALKQGGFVESRRGVEGGYLLARPAATITAGEVLRYIQGARGRRKAEDPFTEMWERVEEAVSGVIDRTNFAELVRAWTERQQRYVPNWDI
jgi:Rrf2 family cysteine metabolism transcriptional repressor